ncbi:MAG TPA: hypothetical protein VL572_02010 [Pyrinomonadaceae bacterium]|nr:hypothetical protein [Pyrinomonadaceae bacterium]
MMKLAYRVYIATLVLLAFVVGASAQTATTTTGMKNPRSTEDPRNIAPTVGTGGPMGGPTGLFTVYDGQVLRRGEFTFSAAYSNFDRDPGNVDITELPVSFQVGVTDHFELFFNTDAYRQVKVNSPRNLSGFYLPNSRVSFNGVVQSPGAIILAPSGPGAGAFENLAIYRPPGSQPFVQFPYIGGSAGTFGLQFSGPAFGFPANTNATLGPPIAAGDGADLFPGIGSVFGGILPGIVFQTVCTNGAATCNQLATSPTVFTTAPSYLPDAPFINRTFGESAFSTYTVGGKVRFTGVNNPVGFGIVGFYRFYGDTASDVGGFNMLQRGASPGGNFGDFGASLFLDARVARWMNVSGNLGYNFNADVKGEFPGGTFTLLDRPDELLISGGVDFPVNRWFQPIVEYRVLKYMGGRTPNAFENNPQDFIAGFRVWPTRWAGFGFAYRYHTNQQDADSFDEDDVTTGTAFTPCVAGTSGCTPSRTTTFSGIPPGFQISQNPHGAIIQVFAGRRNPRQGPIVNIPANVTAVVLSDTEVTLPCPAGTIPGPGVTCADNTTINVTTTAVDAENDVLTYNYTFSGGRIVGTGANVQWDLSGLAPGSYTVTAAVDDGCGLCGATKTTTVVVAACPNCVRPCECATLSVSGPAGITQPGDAMTFTANVTGGTASNLTYNWTVSAGTIESGQGTPSITVRTTREMANTNVTATVDVGGQDPACNCPRTASEQGSVAPAPQAVLVDEFGKMPNDDIRGRLDAFFAELSNNPNNQGYIILYGTEAEMNQRERLITNHITFRNFDRSRITIVRGGAHPTGTVYTRLYRIPPGAENPAP